MKPVVQALAWAPGGATHLRPHVLLVEADQERDVSLGALHGRLVQRMPVQATQVSRTCAMPSAQEPWCTRPGQQQVWPGTYLWS